MSGVLLMFTYDRIFMRILLTFGWCHHSLEADQTSQFRGSKLSWILGYNRVLRGFDGLSSVSGSKLWPNFWKLIREIPQLHPEVPEIIGIFFSIISEPETLESRSRALNSGVGDGGGGDGGAGVASSPLKFWLVENLCKMPESLGQ